MTLCFLYGGYLPQATAAIPVAELHSIAGIRIKARAAHN